MQLLKNGYNNMSYNIEENPNGEFYKNGDRYNIEPINHDDDINAIYQYAFDNGFLQSYKIDQYNAMGLKKAKEHHRKQTASIRWHYEQAGVTLADAGITTDIGNADTIPIVLDAKTIHLIKEQAKSGTIVKFKLSSEVFVRLSPDDVNNLIATDTERSATARDHEEILNEKIVNAKSVDDLLKIKWDL